jgi:hypothetical protein
VRADWPAAYRISHYFEAGLARFDAVIHIDETRALEPLERTSAWERSGYPRRSPRRSDTRPSGGTAVTKKPSAQQRTAARRIGRGATGKLDTERPGARSKPGRHGLVIGPTEGGPDVELLPARLAGVPRRRKTS